MLDASTETWASMRRSSCYNGKKKEFTGKQKSWLFLGFATYLLQKPEQDSCLSAFMVIITSESSSNAFMNMRYQIEKNLIFWMNKYESLAWRAENKHYAYYVQKW